LYILVNACRLLPFSCDQPGLLTRFQVILILKRFRGYQLLRLKDIPFEYEKISKDLPFIEGRMYVSASGLVK